MTRFPSSAVIIRIPFSYYLVFVRELKRKKGKRVLLGNLVDLCQRMSGGSHRFPDRVRMVCAPQAPTRAYSCFEKTETDPLQSDRVNAGSRALKFFRASGQIANEINHTGTLCFSGQTMSVYVVDMRHSLVRLPLVVPRLFSAKGAGQIKASNLSGSYC